MYEVKWSLTHLKTLKLSKFISALLAAACYAPKHKNNETHAEICQVCKSWLYVNGFCSRILAHSLDTVLYIYFIIPSKGFLLLLWYCSLYTDWRSPSLTCNYCLGNKRNKFCIMFGGLEHIYSFSLSCLFMLLWLQNIINCCFLT